MSGQAMKGHLDLLLLAVLSDGAKHGYAVIEELRLRSDGAFDHPEGTIYPALHRLEKAGYLESGWSEVQGRKRRTYSLTSKGTTALDAARVSWDEFSIAVGSVLRGVPWPTTP
ncbi:MAG TPA: helix-turn-helix transcriptional regulator [Acidimicrobiia bacterium]|nr:helix-turn-helix transcriptional regulator [Acidimicrobiia bacterium]